MTIKLGYALDRIESLELDEVVFAKRPWTLETESEIGRLDDDNGVPPSVSNRGFDYFIDVPTALEVLEVLSTRDATPSDKRELLLHYGEFDAYPSWVYSK